MRCHDTKCEKKYVFFPSKEENPYFPRKTVFFRTEEKTGFLKKKNYKFVGS
jgi:hypothetical protein